MNPTEVGEIELASCSFLARALEKYRKGIGKYPFYTELIH